MRKLGSWRLMKRVVPPGFQNLLYARRERALPGHGCDNLQLPCQYNLK